MCALVNGARQGVEYTRGWRWSGKLVVWPSVLTTLSLLLPPTRQDASVHEILENGEMVGRVLGELGGTLRLLDDLEENLAVFDARLRHMREDISGGCRPTANLAVVVKFGCVGCEAAPSAGGHRRTWWVLGYCGLCVGRLRPMKHNL